MHHKEGCKGTAFTEGPSGCLLCGGRMFPAPEPGLSKEESFDLHRLKEGARVRVAQRPISPVERPFSGLEGRFVEYSTPRGFARVAVKVADADAAGVRDRIVETGGDETLLLFHPESLRRIDS